MAKSAVVEKTVSKKNTSQKVAGKKLISKKAAASKKPVAKKAASKSKRAAKKEGKTDVLALDLSFIGSKDEVAETRNVASRTRVRGQLDTDVEAFLASGGNISSIDANVMADPPRKPESNYGSRPI